MIRFGVHKSILAIAQLHRNIDVDYERFVVISSISIVYFEYFVDNSHRHRHFNRPQYLHSARLNLLRAFIQNLFVYMAINKINHFAKWHLIQWRFFLLMTFQHSHQHSNALLHVDFSNNIPIYYYLLCNMRLAHS